jgi:uncharacterized Rmd1/YagE family protein
MNPALTGRFLPPHMPPRSTKLSEKLVLLPESVEEVDEKGEFGQDDDIGPPKDDEEYRRPGREKSKSYAERLPKARRTEKELARVTAYCTAQAYKMQATTAFIKDRHMARTKLYDDCLYAAYHLPLLPGSEGYRIQSSPPLKRPGGKTLLDEAIERSEQMDYHGAYFAEDEEQHSVRGSETLNEAPSPGKEEVLENGLRRGSDHSRRSISPTQSNFLADAFRFAEMFIFSYGVVEFHFEYNSEISRPRVYNDMITLRSGDHMIKLAISHAIAQSTKLSFFEENMATQMEEAKDVPRRLAYTGELGLKREEVVKILGGLFKSRVDVNLCRFKFT